MVTVPTYDFECDCGHKVEVFQSMTAPSEYPCPECADTGCEGLLRKRIGRGAGVIWKGNGPPTPRFGK